VNPCSSVVQLPRCGFIFLPFALLWEQSLLRSKPDLSPHCFLMTGEDIGSNEASAASVGHVIASLHYDTPPGDGVNALIAQPSNFRNPQGTRGENRAETHGDRA
jgi:hypothetical protein